MASLEHWDADLILGPGTLYAAGWPKEKSKKRKKENKK